MYSIVNSLMIILILIRNSVCTGDKRKQLICDSADKLNELKSLEIDRFITNKDTVYLFTKSKLITFKIPVLFKSRGRRYYVNTAFYEQELNKSDDDKIIIDKNEYLIGYLVFTQNKTNYEVFRIDKTSTGFLRLKFDEKPGERVKFDYDGFSGPNYEYEPIVGSSFVLIWNGKRKETFDIRYRSNTFTILFVKDSVLKAIGSESRREGKSKYTIKSAVFHRYEGDRIFQENSSLLELDEKLNFHISQYGLNEVEVKHPVNRLAMNPVQQTFSVEQFFMCLSKITRSRDVKGVIHLKDTFFVLIGRFYLTIKDDLFSSRFEITDRHYETARQLDFGREDIRFENFAMKYAKGKFLYFVLEHVLNQSR